MSKKEFHVKRARSLNQQAIAYRSVGTIGFAADLRARRDGHMLAARTV